MIKQAEKSYAPLEVERQVQEFWSRTKAYQKTVAARAKGEDFYFGDGPPFTTGSIHLGQVLNKTIKDLVVRYHRMRGYHVRDQPGYDMHGLPIEVQVEKTLGITNKKEIEELGIEKFVNTCRTFATDLLQKMTKQFQSLGIWLDWDRPYMTIRNEFIEAAWWTLKRAHERDWIYEALRSIQWCSRCETALADAEVEYSDENGSLDLRQVPNRGEAERIPPHLDHDPVDASRESRDRGTPRFPLCEGEDTPREEARVHLAHGERGPRRHGPRRRDEVFRRRDEERQRPRRAGLCPPAPGEASVPERCESRVGPQGGLFRHSRRRVHRARALGPRARTGGFRARSETRPPGILSRRRPRPLHAGRWCVCGPERPGGEPSDRRGPARRPRVVRRGDDPPCLWSLLALHDPDLVPCDRPVVPQCDRIQTQDGRRGRAGQMVPGLGRIGAPARLDEQSPGLVYLAAAILGNPAPDLAVREVPVLDHRRFGRRPPKGEGLHGRDGPPSARHRPRRPAV